ncbi:hypothetical protein AB0C93_07270 [Streptomyces sp. NPDC048518]|uniref:hypothetical protein n=1 Tax=Streptomyces sp. NPDC048518 TaxID=3155029 RepID=UPI0033CD60DC
MDGAGGQAPRAAEMRGRAREFVDRATAGNRLPLDFSVASLRLVDFLVEGLRKGGRERSEITGTLCGLGAYLGEVLVRRAGAVWVDFDAEQREFFGQSVGVRMPDGRFWNPFGKVVNCLERGGREGSEPSLQDFYLTLPGRTRSAA